MIGVLAELMVSSAAFSSKHQGAYQGGCSLNSNGTAFYNGKYINYTSEFQNETVRIGAKVDSRKSLIEFYKNGASLGVFAQFSVNQPIRPAVSLRHGGTLTSIQPSF